MTSWYGAFSNAIAILANQAGSALLLEDGTLPVWPGNRTSPIPPVRLPNAVEVVAADLWLRVLLTDGSVRDAVHSNEPAFAGFRGMTDLAGGGLNAIFYGAVGEGAPWFQPVRTNRPGFLGTPLLLKSRAVGRMPITCQWRFAGENLDGETNLWLTLRPGRQTTGAYECVAANVEGSATQVFHVSFSQARLSAAGVQDMSKGFKLSIESARGASFAINSTKNCQKAAALVSFMKIWQTRSSYKLARHFLAKAPDSPNRYERDQKCLALFTLLTCISTAPCEAWNSMTARRSNYCGARLAARWRA